MNSTLCYQIFQTFTHRERLKFEKFLASPYLNQREDVRRLFRILNDLGERVELLDKKAVFSAMFPGRSYDNLQFNYVLNFLSERMEQFLACEEMLNDRFQNRFLRCRAFRKRGLTRPFERNARELWNDTVENPLRNAQHWLETYQLACEGFANDMMMGRHSSPHLTQLLQALERFVTLEHLRWASTGQALSAMSKQETDLGPYAAMALKIAEGGNDPAALMLQKSYEVLHDPGAEAAFEQLKDLIRSDSGLFSTTEARDIYMAAINFCIKKHNQGIREYTSEAFVLYREALEKGLLLENGILPKSTYGNINNLAHLTGASQWARQFLEQYKMNLSPDVMETVYKYNIAIHHFRCSEYSKTLELLRDIEFSEVFVNLDVRKMLARSYFEMGEWQALSSLVESSKAYLRRLKNTGYHRESYLNLMKFIPKVEKAMRQNKARRLALVNKIQSTKYVAEREWLVGKLG
ncbi:MAG: hypothetical protein JNJ57_04260 [Saprospiraceae bacterium]|nr:hypothetical protein [Saprospiraceae bacterium]